MASFLLVLGVVAATSLPQVPQPAQRLVQSPVMPQVIGLQAQAALDRLTRLRIHVDSVRYGAPSEQATVAWPNGAVARQYPPAGTSVTSRTPVYIEIVGPEPAITGLAFAWMPDLRGKSLALARDLLTRARLGLGQVSARPVPAGSPPNLVVDQSYAPGTQLRPGTVVNVGISAPGPPVVPSLAGLTLSAARSRLAAEQLQLGQVVTRTVPGSVGNLVIEQGVPAGTRVAPGTAVPVTLAQPQAPELAQVPPLLGLTLAAARDALAARKLVLAGVERRTTAYGTQPDVVVDQRPDAATRVKLGSGVVVVLSSPAAPPPVAVPDVVRLSEREALLRLRDAGLVGRIRRRVEGGRPTGEVLAQQPGPGATVDARSAVALDVAVYTWTPVPELSSLDSATAVRDLERSRLRLGTVARGASFWQRGIIFHQRPDPGTEVEPGSRVDISITDRRLVIVPNVRDSAEPGARALLERWGLSAGRIRLERSTRAPRTVLAQSPQANDTVDAGTAVDLVVAESAPGPIPPTPQPRPPGPQPRPPTPQPTPTPPGPPPIQAVDVIVPRVEGLTLPVASDTLGRLGLRLEVAGVDTTQGGAGPFSVRSQQPAAGARVRRGSAVGVRLWQPPAERTWRIPLDLRVLMAVLGIGGGLALVGDRVRRYLRGRPPHEISAQARRATLAWEAEVPAEPPDHESVRFVPYVHAGETSIDVEEATPAGGDKGGV